MPKKIEISHRTIIFTAILVLSLWFVVRIWDILLMLFISVILMSALNPLVDRLERWHLPRGVAIALIYVLLWGSLGVLIAGIVSPLIDQTAKLIRLLPAAINNIEFFTINQQEISQQVLTRLGALPENILRIIFGFFSNLLGVLTTLVITFYLLLERRHLDKYILLLTGGENQSKSARIVNELERRLGGWVRGELVLMFIVGLMTYLGLLVLGMEIALPLAILAGLLEIIPNIGPTLSAVPAVLVALTIHPLIALATASLYFLVQFFENHLLVPKIMQRAVGVNPLISILGLMVGFRLLGPLGAVMAIPAILVVQTVGLEFFSLKHLENLTEE